MKILIIIFISVSLSNTQQVGEVQDSTSENYDIDFNSDSKSESSFDESFHNNYPTFTYQEDSFEDLTSRDDPLLIPPNPPFYNGPWNIQHEEVSISGLGSFNNEHRGWPTNLPHLPNFGSIVPYPLLNSRSVSPGGDLPSTLSNNQESIKHDLSSRK